MIKLYSIKKNHSGVVRSTLYIEDLALRPMKELEGFGFIKRQTVNGEEFFVFDRSVPIPRFNKFYASRISSPTDPYLKEVVAMLLYLNPSPDALMKKKLAEYIILRFSRIEMKPSKVKPSELIATPVLTFEQVEMVIHVGMFSDYRPPTGVYVLFSKDTKFDGAQRRKIHMDARGAKMSFHYGEAIHIVAEHLIDTYEHVKITSSKIQNTKMLDTKNGSTTVRTIDKYMKPVTKEVIEEHNSIATFKSINAQKKYEQFLELPPSTLDLICATLGVNKTAAIEFRKLKTREDDNNSNGLREQ